MHCVGLTTVTVNGTNLQDATVIDVDFLGRDPSVTSHQSVLVFTADPTSATSQSFTPTANRNFGRGTWTITVTSPAGRSTTSAQLVSRCR
jgi:hypothetical protein